MSAYILICSSLFKKKNVGLIFNLKLSFAPLGSMLSPSWVLVLWIETHWFRPVHITECMVCLFSLTNPAFYLSDKRFPDLLFGNRLILR